MERQCNKCKNTKDFFCFYKKKNGLNGHDSICKDCKKMYHTKNRESILVKKALYREVTKEKKATYQKNYRQKNKELLREYSNNYRTKRRKTDPVYNALLNIRSRLSAFTKLSSINKTKSTLHFLGCSSLEFKNHIEKLFSSTMTWSNYGEWHIDHIIPLSIAKTENDLKKLCHYTNLQPLWAEDNLKKGCKE